MPERGGGMDNHKILTVKERMEEKNVPSSYRESLDNTPSKTAANCESEEMFA